MSTTLSTPEPDTDRRRRTLSAGLALAGAAVTFTTVYVAAGALDFLGVVPDAVGVPSCPPHRGVRGLRRRIPRRRAHAGIAVRPCRTTPGADPAALVVQLVSNVLFLLAPDVGKVAFRSACGPSRVAAAAPVIAAVWMLAGLSGGIAPSLVRSVFHLDSGLLNGATGFVAPAVSAVIGLAFARVDSRRAMTIGIYASIAGSIGIMAEYSPAACSS